jgi:hypothetical protein
MGITTVVGASVPMLVSLVMRRVINLIHQGTSPIVQEQNGLSLATHSVEIGEKSQKHGFELTPPLRADYCNTPEKQGPNEKRQKSS